MHRLPHLRVVPLLLVALGALLIGPGSPAHAVVSTATIAGSVTVPGGGPAPAGIVVYLHSLSAPAGSPPGSTVETDGSGRFSAVVSTADPKFYAVLTDPRQVYYYTILDPDQQSPIVVSVGQTTTITLVMGLHQPVSFSVRPSIHGKAKKGKTLRADPGVYTPAGAVLGYSWRRNGKQIKGAYESSYRLRARDRGKRIKVAITYVPLNYLRSTVVTKATKKVR